MGLKRCKVCGCEIDGGYQNKKKYCDECRKIVMRAQRKAARAKEKKKKDNVSEIISLSKEAQRHRMSYGKYISYLHQIGKEP